MVFCDLYQILRLLIFVRSWTFFGGAPFELFCRKFGHRETVSSIAFCIPFLSAVVPLYFIYCLVQYPVYSYCNSVDYDCVLLALLKVIDYLFIFISGLGQILLTTLLKPFSSFKISRDSLFNQGNEHF
jgi:ascorbate-specific PTS system EIIC-type component UlaA